MHLEEYSAVILGNVLQVDSDNGIVCLDVDNGHFMWFKRKTPLHVR